MLHWAAGWLVNTESTPPGRRWHHRYRIGGLPVQFASLPYVVFGWVIVCYNLGRATSVWVGWPVFLLPAIVALVVVVLRQPERSRLPRR